MDATGIAVDGKSSFEGLWKDGTSEERKSEIYEVPPEGQISPNPFSMPSHRNPSQWGIVGYE